MCVSRVCLVFLFFVCVRQVFGMTASPTVECVDVLQCRAYVCEDELIEEFQANAQWEILHYPVSIQFRSSVHVC